MSPQASPAHRPFRLLIADDDEAFRETVCEVCRPFLEVIEAASGDEALCVTHREQLDLALCDLHMPGHTGLDVLSEFRRAQQRPGILMSARVSPVERREAERLSVYRVLEKPFTRKQLLATVAEALESVFPQAGLLSQFRHRGVC
ncbi:MAG TPA: response regulator [Planctomycetaceae bacterium]|nr:response regulator [Planctomycetaceae bacterium]